MFIEKKCEMIFHVGIDSNEEANKFLRKLWAEFRREFGKCAWNYTPTRIGIANTIIFGMMDIEIPEGSLIVSICYLRKGTIKTISFGFMDQKPSEHRLHELNQNIQKIINISKKNLDQRSEFFFKTGINIIVKPLGYYKGEAFVIHCSQGSTFNLAISTTGYDKIDAQTECQSKILKCLDLLSVETNSPFWKYGVVSKAQQEQENEEIFVEDLEWIDDYPIINEKLRLSKSGKLLLDLIVKDQLNESQKVLLRGCQHFHTARKYDAQIYDRLKYHSTEEIESDLYQINFEERDEKLSIAAKMGSTHMEIATVLYLSALEVASSINITNPKNCSECGQPIYNIGRRVVDIVEKYLNVALGKEFKEYYKKRSKYLHSGQILYNYSYIGTTIPQLDTSDPTGCKVHSSIPLLNLREYTSFCLRKILQLLVSEQTN
ncbi:hypothetical protein PN478_04275 [Dolichospermum circinale CS-534/05]|uniref:hypothetical protein n=1 Tax=Dolichospermum circinale TaxID=109265 RepID=UPI00232AD90F|nr:hypothetical protein [Dolichospermum circinale]MDB9455476.1 hypothetical protein [Dolichospermum circinale CS-541/06]MDB9461811.1 hypothetical protein [Dolichospermum circinale CS-541/04]MDB9489740.1 hypothetical protein [Dolichospermum circinale CS-534/05]MDB9546568.1 hypothetical protein [Dolichospermum circinale CS-1031]